MLICVHKYEYVVRKGPEVVMQIDEMKVISFDRFQMKLPSSVHYDDYVRVHLDFLKHFNDKLELIKQQFEMPDINKIHTFEMPQLPVTEAQFSPQMREDRPVFQSKYQKSNGFIGKRIVL